MSDLTGRVRRMVIGLLASSSAVLLLTGCEGDRLRDFIMSRAIFAPPADEGPKPWTVGPEMIDLLRSGGGGIFAPAVEIAGAFSEAGRAAADLLVATADRIRDLALFITGQNPDIPMETALVQAAAFWKYSIKYSVPIDLVIAVAQTESRFDPGARSPAGAAGVMQVMWRVHSGLLLANGIMDEAQLHDPELGIAAGSLLLSRYLRAEGDVKTALGRYFGGSPTVYWRRVSRNLEWLHRADIVPRLAP